MVEGNMLILILIVSITAIVLLISTFKVHPFLSLLLVALFMGIAANMPLREVVSNITTGFGNTCASIGIVIALGTAIGVFLEKTGAAYTMAGSILKTVGEKRPALAMSIIGYIVSIPVFCDSGFVILSALNKSLARRAKVPMATMAVALSTGLYATHTLVPPTPGPIAAAANLHADLGLVVLAGLLIAIPSTAAGYLYALWIGKKLPVELDEASDDLETVIAKRGALPSPFMSFAPIFLPILLIGLSSLVDFPTIKSAIGASGALYIGMRFLGHPIIALALGFALCLLLTTKFATGPGNVLNDWMGEALKNAGTIILITAAGGALGMIIAKTNIGAQLGNTLKVYNLGIFLPFIISAALKTAQGSSTVALITTSTIIYPLLESLGLGTPMGAVLATAAVGCGSMVVSHANDSYFWVVSQFSGLKTITTYRSHSAATFIQGIVGIMAVYCVTKIVV